TISQLKDDRQTKAVVLRVDSPGGSALASDLVAEQLRQCAEKRPVIVTQGDVAASGGYWLSMYGDEIYALPSTISGSIGVIGAWLWNDGLGEKLGHTSDHVQVGDKADIGFGIRLLLAGPMLPDRNLTTEERGEVEEQMLTLYRAFLEKVGSGRNMDPDDVDKVAQGRVFSGTDGVEAGLVDKIGGLVTAIQAARAAAGIKESEHVKVVEYPKMPSFNLGKLRTTPGLSALFAGEQASPLDPAMEFLENPEWTYIRAVMSKPGRPLFMMPPEFYVRDATWGKGEVSE
ncbi:MAG: S49 family peptidase, partial [Candidatus Krumholzibacteria bacterium]|nr:S49 family peptidase [Candidatus Krumholzibacteria bacterium]